MRVVSTVLGVLTALTIPQWSHGAPARPVENPVRDSSGFPFVFRADAGYAYRRIYTVPITAWTASLSPGASHEPFYAYGTFRWLQGETEFGLGVQEWRVGALLEWHLRRLYLGGGWLVGKLSIDRASNSSSMSEVSAGAIALVGCEPFHFGDRGGTLFLEARLDVATDGMWGPTLAAGYRWR